MVQSHIRSHPVVKAQAALNANKAAPMFTTANGSATGSFSGAFDGTQSQSMDLDEQLNNNNTQDLPSQGDAGFANNHMPEKNNKNILSQELLRKYILYRYIFLFFSYYYYIIVLIHAVQ